jgi:hypothetical protein
MCNIIAMAQLTNARWRLAIFGRYLYRRLADAANEALKQLLVDLQSSESSLGPMHPTVSANVQLIRVHHSIHGGFAKAEAALLPSIHIREHAFERRHPFVAAVIRNLAELY